MEDKSARITVTLEREFFEKVKAKALEQFNANKLDDDIPNSAYEFVFDSNPDSFDVYPKRLDQNFSGNGISVYVSQQFNADFMTRLAEMLIKTYNRAKANFETMKDYE